MFKSITVGELSRLALAGTDGQLCMFSLPSGGYLLCFKTADVAFILTTQRGAARVFKTSDSAFSAASSVGYSALVSYIDPAHIPVGLLAFLQLDSVDPIIANGWANNGEYATVVLSCGASGLLAVDKQSTKPQDHIGNTATVFVQDIHGDRCNVTGEIVKIY